MILAQELEIHGSVVAGRKGRGGGVRRLAAVGHAVGADEADRETAGQIGRRCRAADLDQRCVLLRYSDGRVAQDQRALLRVLGVELGHILRLHLRRGLLRLRVLGGLPTSGRVNARHAESGGEHG